MLRSGKEMLGYSILGAPVFDLKAFDQRCELAPHEHDDVPYAWPN